jgi:chitodextrinase
VTAGCADETPPSTPTDLAVTEQTTSTLSLAWSASNDNVGVDGYRLLIDDVVALTISTGELADADPTGYSVLLGEPVPATPMTATLVDLVCGTTYSVAVEAYDAAGNTSQAATADAATTSCPASPAPPDTTPPSVPQDQTMSAATETSFVMSWSASTDDVGVTGYNLYLNGVRVATVTTTSYTYTGLTCGTTYTVALEARDAAGNVSNRAQAMGPASTLACSSPPSPPPPPSDPTGPEQPTGLLVDDSSPTTVSLSWNSGGANVDGYGVYVDDSRVSSTTEPRATVSGLTCGTAYTLAVDAYDDAGNRSTRATVIASTSACPDSQPPTAPANVTATSRTATSIALSWSSSTDNVGVTGYALYQSGVLTGTTSGTTGIFSGLTCNTSYTLAVEAYDANDNRSAKTTVMVSTTACPGDTVPPSPPTNQAISGATATSFVMTWSPSTDNVGVTGYNVFLNGVNLDTITTTSYTYTGLTCGTTYTVALEARDAAGNVSNKAEATGQASTLACSSPTPPPPPPTGSSASLYVSTTGLDTNLCTQTQPCASFQRAYALAAPGALVQVAGGTYPGQGLSEVAGKAPPNVVFEEAPGARVVLDGISVNGADYLTFRDFETSYVDPDHQRGVFAGQGSTGIRFERIDAGNVSTLFASDITVLGGDYGPCRAPASGCWLSNIDVSDNVVIDGALFHDYNYLPACVQSADCHWRALFVNGPKGFTLRNSTFRNNVFEPWTTVSGPDAGARGVQDVLIENNQFGRNVQSPSGTGGGFGVAWCQNTSVGYRNITIRFNSYAAGSFSGAPDTVNAGGTCRVENFRAYGNLMGRAPGQFCQPQGPGTEIGTVAWAHDVFTGTVAGTCSTTDVNIGGTSHPFYANDTGAPQPGDYQLAGPQMAADNRVPVSMGCPATDAAGRTRGLDGFCDAGAFER